MALTPLLNEAGRRAAEIIDENFNEEDEATKMVNFEASELVVILGFGQMGQVLANFLSTPLASGLDSDALGSPYVAFDLDPSVVKASRKLGFPILYGDGSRPSVLQSAGISSPKAVMVMFTGKKRTTEAVQRLRVAFPGIPIYARADDLTHLLDLKKAGATDAILEDAETSLQLGSKLLKGFGVMSDDVNFLSQLFRDSMELQAQESLGKSDDRETEIMKPLQVRVSDFNGVRENNSPRANQKDVTDILSFRGKVDDDPQQTVNSEDDGVLYCNLEKGNGLSIESNKTGEKILTEDTLIPLTQKMEEL